MTARFIRENSKHPRMLVTTGGHRPPLQPLQSCQRCPWYRNAIWAAYSGMKTNLWSANHSCLPLLRFLAVFLVATVVFAGPTATLMGRVTDPSGAVISGVKVEATNVETNVMFSGETNMGGRYFIPDLPPGTYRVIVRKFAYQTVVKPGVELRVQDVVALNFSMEVGSVTQSVTVEAGAPLIQASPHRGGNFVSSEVRALPLAALNPISLARTLPGAIELPGTQLFGKG